MLAPTPGDGLQPLLAFAETRTAPPARRAALLRDLVASARSAQWQKNALLFAAFVFSAGSTWV